MPPAGYRATMSPNIRESRVQSGLLQVIRRRWYAVALGLLATTVAMKFAMSPHGVYYTQAYVVLLPPQGADAPNAFANTNTSGPVNMAGIVGRIMAQNAAPQPVSDQVSILGEGITDGYIVRQPNDGGQWSVQFKRPVLDVQVAGATPAVVTASLNRVLAEIEANLRRLQQDTGTAPAQMIQAKLSPPAPSLFYVEGSAVRAGFATLLLGVGLSLGVARLQDWVMWRDRRRSRPGLLREG